MISRAQEQDEKFHEHLTGVGTTCIFQRAKMMTPTPATISTRRHMVMEWNEA